MRRLLLALGLTTVAAAQTLYAPTPPDGSAFVRLVGGREASFNGQSVTAPVGAVSPYIVMPEGVLKASAGGAKGNFKVQAGRFYTVALLSGKLQLLTDPDASNRAKALLTLYNLGGAPALSLKTADGRTSVIAGVKPGASASRAVNGVTADLGVFSGTRSLKTLKGVQLERGGAYAVVVTPGGTTLTQSSTQAR